MPTCFWTFSMISLLGNGMYGSPGVSTALQKRKVDQFSIMHLTSILPRTVSTMGTEGKGVCAAWMRSKQHIIKRNDKKKLVGICAA